MSESGIAEEGRRFGYSKNVVLAAIAGSLGSFSFGYNLGSLNVISPVMLKCSSVTDTGWGCFRVEEGNWSNISSFLCLGALIGCLGGGKLVDRMGRRGLILWNNSVYVCGLGLMLGAMHWSMLLMGRFLVGIGVGVSCVAVPMYLTEISSWDVRGVIGSLHQLLIVIGYLVSLLLGLGVNLNGFMWRVLLGADIIVCSLQILFAVSGLMPESPKYWMLRGETERAESALRYFRGPKYDPDELDLYSNTTNTAGVQQSFGLFTLLRTRFSQVYKSLGLVVLLHLGQQLSGVNAIFYFSTIMFQGNVYVPVLIAVLNVLMTVLSLALMDRAGRRPLLLTSLIGMCLCYSIFTFSYYQGLETVKAGAVLGFIASFALGMGPVPWLMLGEVFAPWALSAGVSLGVSVNWLSNFVVVAVFQRQLHYLQKNVMLPYLAFLLVLLVWTAKYLPETKGRPAALL